MVVVEALFVIDSAAGFESWDKVVRRAGSDLSPYFLILILRLEA